MACTPPVLEKIDEILTDEAGRTIRRTIYRPVPQVGAVENPCSGYIALPTEGVAKGSLFVYTPEGGYWLAPGAQGDTLRMVGVGPVWAP